MAVAACLVAVQTCGTLRSSFCIRLVARILGSRSFGFQRIARKLESEHFSGHGLDAELLMDPAPLKYAKSPTRISKDTNRRRAVGISASRFGRDSTHWPAYVQLEYLALAALWLRNSLLLQIA